MAERLTIDIHHLTRVEGHGDIHVVIEDGRLKEAVWEVVETPRFFEVMLKGKHYTSAPVLASRICGICSIGHCLASLRATEQAFGITIPEPAHKLRLLAKHGETLQSHTLHLFFLALPDFLGVPSVLPLMDTHPDVIRLAQKLKGLANRICEVVAGRTTHPVSLQVGGVARMPSKRDLEDLRSSVASSMDLLKRIVELFGVLSIPDFSRETEFVSLRGESEYPFMGGRIMSSDGVDLAESEYLQATNEVVAERGTSKLCRLSRNSYAVGALARFNNNFSWLHPEAAEIAAHLGLSPVSHNPFMNHIAQLVECVHVTRECIRLLDELLWVSPEAPILAEVVPMEGQGTGAVEVPRGILFHHYEYDHKGRVVRADCVIPTTQNNANIHDDLSALVQRFSTEGMKEKELELLCSMLVRAYDPCISCSVH